MNLVKRNASELEGPALDYAMLIATGWESDRPVDGQLRRLINGRYEVCLVGPSTMRFDRAISQYWRSPSNDWAITGPLIEQYRIDVEWVSTNTCRAEASNCMSGFGPTALIAVCRAIVASVLGVTVQIPEELLL